MPPVSGPERGCLATQILRQLSLADKTSVWGTLGTIRAHLSFDVEKDAQTLLGAVSGPGVDYRTIIDLLTNRSNEQCQQIAKEFLDFTKQDLLTTLQAAVPANLEGLVAGLLRPAAQYDAHEIKAALKGPEVETLTEILCTRTNQQLREILRFYKNDFKSDFEKDVASGTSGWLKDLLVALSQGNRERYSGVIDYVLINQDTKALVDADGGGKAGRLQESEWVRILTQRSPEHLNRVFSCYQKRTGLPVEAAVEGLFRGQAQAACSTLVSLLRNTPLYLARKLHQAVKGPRGNARTLARIMISRRETDLLSIRVEFRKHYGISLYSFLMAETDGNGQAALLGLCRAEDL